MKLSLIEVDKDIVLSYWSLVSVAAHLRGMQPTPSTDKDILAPNGKLKTLNITNQTHN